MNILITGATGFIGKHLVQRLVQEGHHCRCMARSFDEKDHIFARHEVELFRGDVTKPETLKDVGKGIDAAYHLAATGHVASVSEEDYTAFFNLNVNGTRNIVRACGRDSVSRFIHFSSTAAMGLIKVPKIDETVPCQPQTPYQKSKYESEIAVFQEGKRYGMEAIVLRPCMIYGPGGKGEFLKFCRLIKKGIFPRVGLRKNLTPMVHVRDVVRAAISALDKGRAGEVYLISSETSPPLKEIHSSITRALQIRRIYFYLPFRAVLLAAYLLEKWGYLRNKPPIVSRKNIVSVVTGRVFSISKAHKDLDYKPEERLDTAIQETVKWYQKMNLL